jgi:hypothetical protein
LGRYEEEIYSRAEHQFGSIERAQSWLMSFDKPKKNPYEKEAFELGKDVGNLNEIKKRFDKAENIKDLEDLQGLAKGISSSRLKKEILPDIETKIKELKIAEETAKKQAEDEERIRKEEQRIAEETARQFEKVQTKEREIEEEEQDIEEDEAKQIERVDNETDRLREEAERLAAQEEDEIEQIRIRTEMEREVLQQREGRLREIQRTSGDRRKRVNAKRQLLKIEKRKFKI